MSCQHHNKVGDNNGISCADCGIQLSGYGDGGHADHCHHKYYKDDKGYEYCIYCEMPKEFCDEGERING